MIGQYIARRAGSAIGTWILLFAACGGSENEMGDMPGMSSAESRAAQDADSDASSAMRTQLERMSALPLDSLAAALPSHRQMVANMLAQMNREMSSMNMASDAGWTATVDSIRSDLTSMPNMTAGEISVVIPGHRARVERLMSMHEAMMERMQRGTP